MPAFTVSEIARRVGARVEGDPERAITGVAAIDAAGASDLTFLEREALLSRLGASTPGAILVRAGVDIPEAAGAVALRVDEPQLAFIEVVRLFHPPPRAHPGIHPTAMLGAGVRLGAEVSLGPHVVVEEGSAVGDRTEVAAGCFLGAGSRVGRDCRLGHGVSILHGSILGDRVLVHAGARIGSDGFGFAATSEGAVKIPQVGRCVIGDDVEIGANSTVDRGALGDTTIGARTKLDNLVHVGHNVRIGEDCMIVAQVGIAGSARIGRGVALAGQAGIAGHLSVGAGARVSARSAVFKDVPPGETWGGYPARPHRSFLKASSALLRLPHALARIAAIERRLGLDPGTPAAAPDDDAAETRPGDP